MAQFARIVDASYCGALSGVSEPSMRSARSEGGFSSHRELRIELAPSEEQRD